MSNLKNFTDNELRKELAERGYFTQNLWQTDDIIVVAKDRFNLDITEEDAKYVFDVMGDKMDAEIGINWDVIAYFIESVLINKYK